MSKPAGQRRGGGNGKPEAQTTPNSSRARLPSGLQGGTGPGGPYGYLKPMRRENAAQMAELRAKRSPQEQLDRLDKRLGVGVGAVRERKALAEQIKAK